jgi:dTDP-glucose pyrophosphorylase
MKGIIFEKGSVARLYLKKSTSKQLLSVYNNTMIYLPFFILMLSGTISNDKDLIINWYLDLKQNLYIKDLKLISYKELKSHFK